MKSGLAIFNILSGDADVSALVGTRIFPNVAKNKTQFPFIIYDVNGETPNDDKDGVSSLDVDSVMVSCYSKTYAEASDLARKMRTALDRISGTYGGVVIQSIKYNGYNDLFDDDSGDGGIYRKALDFDIRIVNTNVEQPFLNIFSLDFDGVDDFLNCGNSLTIKPSNEITISAWVKPNAWDWQNPGGALAHNEYIVGNVAVGGWGIYLDFAGTEANPTTTINFIVRVNDTGSGSSGYITATIDSSTVRNFVGWKNIIATFDGNNAKLYYDGGDNVVSASSGTGANIEYSTIPQFANVDVIIGADSQSNTSGVSGESTAHNYYYGNIDEVAIFDSAITSAEVDGIYNNGIPTNLLVNNNGYVSKADLQGYWRNGDGDIYPTITDDSTNTNNGTMKNMSSIDIVKEVP